MESLTEEDPRSVGGYELRARLGQGGFGEVYLGLSPGGRAVAVKMLRPELGEDRDFLRRFRLEVAAAQQVNGLYTAHVVATGLDERRPWVATAFVPGPSLDRAVAANGPLPELAVWRLLAGLVEALQAIHACGLVHRDLKPENVLLAADGPRVIDFGISKSLDGTSMTATGMIIGTPSFMAPEQANGELVGPASDIFSLGCVLAYAATGAPPWGGGVQAAVLYRVVYKDPVLDGVPPQLRAVIERCLAKAPDARPPLEELAKIGRDGPAAAAAPSPLAFWPPQLAQLIRQYEGHLDDAQLDDVPLNGMDLDGVELDGVELDGSQLVGVRLDGVGLDGRQLDGGHLDGVGLDRGHLDGVELGGVRLDVGLDGVGLDGERPDSGPPQAVPDSAGHPSPSGAEEPDGGLPPEWSALASPPRAVDGYQQPGLVGAPVPDSASHPSPSGAGEPDGGLPPEWPAQAPSPRAADGYQWAGLVGVLARWPGRRYLPAATAGVGVLAAVALTVSMLGRAGDTAVPLVRGDSQAQAVERIDAAGLKPAVLRQIDPHVGSGLVISTKPANGSALRKGATVTVYLSAGPGVPVVRGLTWPQAQARIKAAGFVAVAKKEASAGVKAGRVIGTQPTVGASAPAHARVTVDVSTGPASLILPNVEGEQATAARARLLHLGFSQVKLVCDPHSAAPRGEVDWMTPAPGHRRPSQQITLYTSAGGVAVPSVIGDRPAAAAATLEQDGFAVQTSTVPAPANQAATPGRVYNQTPGAGDAEPRGALIHIFVQPQKPAIPTPPRTSIINIPILGII